MRLRCGAVVVVEVVRVHATQFEARVLKVVSGAALVGQLVMVGIPEKKP